MKTFGEYVTRRPVLPSRTAAASCSSSSSGTASRSAASGTDVTLGPSARLPIGEQESRSPRSNLGHMGYDGEPLIRCPSCRTFVPIEPHVVLLGEIPILDCPVCRGARDLVLERALN